jgi:DNA polymerase-4
MLRSLVVDFNSYFASVEQQFQPRLRQRPVVVVPVLTDSTCCIAASTEAKVFGITTGTPVYEAKKLCPRLHVIEARPALYIRTHHRLVAAVESCLPVDRVMSIDEMHGALTGPWQDPGRAQALAHQIKQTIAQTVGSWLRCSIGIAPNLFLAKTASDLQKPDGLVIIETHQLPHALHSLQLRDLCGIGRNMEQRLHRYGICTVAQLCSASARDLRQAWGSVEGERMYRRLRGGLVPELPTQKSVVSHSHVLPPPQRNETEAHAVLHRLLQKAAARLRRMEYLAGALQLSLFSREQNGWSDELHFGETSNSLEFVRLLDQLWKRRPSPLPSPHQVGVSLFGLVPAGAHTPSLFYERPFDPRLDRAIDLLNESFGKNTVFFGGSFEARASAPLRIAFHHIPELINSEMD